MLDYINYRQAYSTNLGNINILRNKSKYLLFKGWDIIIKEKIKLMAGNYRVKVLKKYLYHSKLSENE